MRHTRLTLDAITIATRFLPIRNDETEIDQSSPPIMAGQDSEQMNNMIKNWSKTDLNGDCVGGEQNGLIKLTANHGWETRPK